MTNHITSTDYAHKKQEVQYVEHAKDSAVESSYELHKERTLEGTDMNNSYAVEGDNSDGKVEWNLRSTFTTISLAALYQRKNANSDECLIRVFQRTQSNFHEFGVFWASSGV
jgi:hypothetical protein